MENAKLTEQLQLIVHQMMERFNLVTAMALDEKYHFEDAEKQFKELIMILETYRCYDLAADQMMNFSKVAFFREQYYKALQYAEAAAAKGTSSEKTTEAESSLHDMAYKILEISVQAPKDSEEARLISEVEKHLTSEDYCNALENVRRSIEMAASEEASNNVKAFARLLSLEVLRQGLRQEKLCNWTEALKLLRCVCPFLNEKRAMLVKKEIKKLEVVVSNE